MEVKINPKDYFVDDDGYLLHGSYGDYVTIAELPNDETGNHIQTLTMIIGTWPDLLAACRCAEADLYGMVADYMDVDIETSPEPQAKTVRELRQVIARIEGGAQIETLKESDVLERVGAAIDEMDADDLAKLHNHVTNHDAITGDSIELQEGWHLVPKEGAH